jgi:hypothetical protein
MGAVYKIAKWSDEHIAMNARARYNKAGRRSAGNAFCGPVQSVPSYKGTVMADSQPNRLALRIQAEPVQWTDEPDKHPLVQKLDGNDAFLLLHLTRMLVVDQERAVSMLQALAAIYDAAGKRGKHMRFTRWELDELDGYQSPYPEWVRDQLVNSRWLRPFMGGYRLWHHGRPECVFGLYNSRTSYLDVSAGVWKRIRREAIARDGRTCRYCGGEAKPACVDHILPLVRGGRSVPENLCVACKPCNSSKGTQTVDEWRARRG